MYKYIYAYITKPRGIKLINNNSQHTNLLKKANKNDECFNKAIVNKGVHRKTSNRINKLNNVSSDSKIVLRTISSGKENTMRKDRFSKSVPSKRTSVQLKQPSSGGLKHKKHTKKFLFHNKEILEDYINSAKKYFNVSCKYSTTGHKCWTDYLSRFNEKSMLLEKHDKVRRLLHNLKNQPKRERKNFVRSIASMRENYNTSRRRVCMENRVSVRRKTTYPILKTKHILPTKNKMPVNEQALERKLKREKLFRQFCKDMDKDVGMALNCKAKELIAKFDDNELNNKLKSMDYMGKMNIKDILTKVRALSTRTSRSSKDLAIDLEKLAAQITYLNKELDRQKQEQINKDDGSQGTQYSQDSAKHFMRNRIRQVLHDKNVLKPKKKHNIAKDETAKKLYRKKNTTNFLENNDVYFIETHQGLGENDFLKCQKPFTFKQLLWKKHRDLDRMEKGELNNFDAMSNKELFYRVRQSSMKEYARKHLETLYERNTKSKAINNKMTEDKQMLAVNMTKKVKFDDIVFDNDVNNDSHECISKEVIQSLGKHQYYVVDKNKYFGYLEPKPDIEYYKKNGKLDSLRYMLQKDPILQTKAEKCENVEPTCENVILEVKETNELAPESKISKPIAEVTKKELQETRKDADKKQYEDDIFVDNSNSLDAIQCNEAEHTPNKKKLQFNTNIKNLEVEQDNIQLLDPMQLDRNRLVEKLKEKIEMDDDAICFTEEYTDLRKTASKMETKKVKKDIVNTSRSFNNIENLQHKSFDFHNVIKNVKLNLTNPFSSKKSKDIMGDTIPLDGILRNNDKNKKTADKKISRTKMKQMLEENVEKKSPSIEKKKSPTKMKQRLEEAVDKNIQSMEEKKSPTIMKQRSATTVSKTEQDEVLQLLKPMEKQKASMKQKLEEAVDKNIQSMEEKKSSTIMKQKSATTVSKSDQDEVLQLSKPNVQPMEKNKPSTIMKQRLEETVDKNIQFIEKKKSATTVSKTEQDEVFQLSKPNVRSIKIDELNKIRNENDRTPPKCTFVKNPKNIKISEDTSKAKDDGVNTYPGNQIRIIRDTPNKPNKPKNKKQPPRKKDEIKFPPQKESPGLKLKEACKKDELVETVKMIKNEMETANMTLRKLSEQLLERKDKSASEMTLSIKNNLDADCICKIELSKKDDRMLDGIKKSKSLAKQLITTLKKEQEIKNTMDTRLEKSNKRDDSFETWKNGSDLRNNYYMCLEDKKEQKQKKTVKLSEKRSQSENVSKLQKTIARKEPAAKKLLERRKLITEEVEKKAVAKPLKKQTGQLNQTIVKSSVKKDVNISNNKTVAVKEKKLKTSNLVGKFPGNEILKLMVDVKPPLTTMKKGVAEDDITTAINKKPHVIQDQKPVRKIEDIEDTAKELKEMLLKMGKKNDMKSSAVENKNVEVLFPANCNVSNAPAKLQLLKWSKYEDTLSEGAESIKVTPVNPLEICQTMKKPLPQTIEVTKKNNFDSIMATLTVPILPIPEKKSKPWAIHDNINSFRFCDQINKHILNKEEELNNMIKKRHHILNFDNIQDEKFIDCIEKPPLYINDDNELKMSIRQLTKLVTSEMKKARRTPSINFDDNPQTAQVRLEVKKKKSTEGVSATKSTPLLGIVMETASYNLQKSFSDPQVNDTTLVQIKIFDDNLEKYLKRIIKVKARLGFRDKQSKSYEAVLYDNEIKLKCLNGENDKIANSLEIDLLKSSMSEPIVRVKIKELDESVEEERVKKLNNRSFTNLNIRKKGKNEALLQFKVIDPELQDYINQVNKIKARIEFKNKNNNPDNKKVRKVKFADGLFQSDDNKIQKQGMSTSVNGFVSLQNATPVQEIPNISPQVVENMSKNFGKYRSNKVKNREVVTNDDKKVWVGSCKNISTSSDNQKTTLDIFIDTIDNYLDAKKLEEASKLADSEKSLFVMEQKIEKRIPKSPYFNSHCNLNELNIDCEDSSIRENEFVSELIAKPEDELGLPLETSGGRKDNINIAEDFIDNTLKTICEEDASNTQHNDLENLKQLTALLKNKSEMLKLCKVSSDELIENETSIPEQIQIENEIPKNDEKEEKIETNSSSVYRADANYNILSGIVQTAVDKTERFVKERTNGEFVLTHDNPTRVPNSNDRNIKKEHSSHSDVPFKEGEFIERILENYKNNLYKICSKEANMNTNRIETPRLRYWIIKYPLKSDELIKRKRKTSGERQEKIKVHSKTTLKNKDKEQIAKCNIKLAMGNKKYVKKYCEKLCIPPHRLSKQTYSRDNGSKDTKFLLAKKDSDKQKRTRNHSVRGRRRAIWKKSSEDGSSSSKDTLRDFDMSNAEIANKNSLEIIKRLEKKFEEFQSRKTENMGNSNKFVNADLTIVLRKLEDDERRKKARKATAVNKVNTDKTAGTNSTEQFLKVATKTENDKK